MAVLIKSVSYDVRNCCTEHGEPFLITNADIGHPSPLAPSVTAGHLTACWTTDQLLGSEAPSDRTTPLGGLYESYGCTVLVSDLPEVSALKLP